MAHIIKRGRGHVEPAQRVASLLNSMFIFGLLLVVFELFVASATELPKIVASQKDDTAQMIGGVFGKRDSLNTPLILKELDHILDPKTPALSEAKQAILVRLYDLMPPSDRTAIFFAKIRDQWPSSKILGYNTNDTFLDPNIPTYYDIAGGFLYEYSEEGSSCRYYRPEEPTRAGALLLGKGLHRPEAYDICRKALLEIKDEERVELLRRSLTVVLSRYDFFDPQLFTIGLSLGDAEKQRNKCAKLTEPVVVAQGCIGVKDLGLVPNWRITQINLDILGDAFPNLVTKDAVDYFDMFVFLISWSASAALLGYLLAARVFEVQTSATIGFRRILVPLVLQLQHHLRRLPYLWALLLRLELYTSFYPTLGCP